MQFLHGAENKMLILFSCKKLIQLTMQQWKAEWGAPRENDGTPLELAHGSSNFERCCNTLSERFDCKIIKKLIDPNGRYISIQARINDEDYFLVNVYGLNNENQVAQFDDHLTGILKKRSHMKIR